MLPTRFDNLLDLARLPWFEVQGGRLRADPAIGPAVDVHTHLALAYGPPGRVNLERPSSETEHYQPKERAFDLDLYANKNLTPEDLKRLEHDLVWASVTAGGMRATHTTGNLAREMGELGITASVLLPIELIALSHNSERWLEVTRGRGEFVCFGSVHPYRPGMRRRLDALVARGARGIKMHPAVQLVPPDDRRVLKLARLCGERGLPILFHCGPVDIETRLGRRFSQVRRYERVISEHPETTFVLGHSGALQLTTALDLSRRYRNVYLEIASQGLSGVRTLVEQAPPDRLLFGTDWPFYHQAIGLAKVLMATEGNEAARRAVLHENARRLLGLKS